MKSKKILIGIIALFIYSYSYSQIGNADYFRRIELKVDTLVFNSNKDTAQYKGNTYLLFNYSEENEICNVQLYPSNIQKINGISLIESADYTVLDSIINFNNQYYTFKIQFHHLSESEFLHFRFRLRMDSADILQDIPLLPITKTTVKITTKVDDLSVGEEKRFELSTNHIENIELVPDWQSQQDVDYRIVETNGQLYVHLMAYSTGSKAVNINLQTKKPNLVNGQLVNNLPLISHTFQVKTGGLVFLQTDKTDFVMDDKSKNEGIEIQIDNNKLLQLNTVYLVESKEATGSPLIAEIITKTRLANKILCQLRVYNYHKKSDGYLYLKDGNTAKFITNFNIIPKVTIYHIKIMRNGKDWVDDATIFPGETIDIRLEGQSLDKAQFRFGELVILAADTIIRNENYVEYKLKVPITISKKTIEIYSNNQNTGKLLTVKEYSTARPFDYIVLNYGTMHRTVSRINGPELYDKTIKDLVISFLPDKIDSLTKLYGKQYVTIDVKILGKKDEIIDIATIENIAICPSEKSPRYQFYDKSDCKSTEISLNSYISNRTYDLTDWSKIKLTIKNPSEKCSQNAQSKTVEIVLQKHYNFDIDVSFPAGLLMKKVNTTGYAALQGLSMSVLGQFSFYQKDKINRYKPFKIGFGFLALNAFNIAHDGTATDIGTVVLASLSPTNPERKLAFSLYLGGGYLLNAKTLFWLIGPGFSVRI